MRLTKAPGLLSNPAFFKSPTVSLWHPAPATPLSGTAAMNTFLLAALCLLGSWAALAEGVTVQVSPVPTLVQLALCPQCTGLMS